MLEHKIGQMLMVGFEGLSPPDYILEWLASGRIGGVILFTRNIANLSQVAALTQACHQAAPEPILIGIDQEGGVVARLRETDGFTESPGAMPLAAARSPDLARRVARVLADELRALGINWNFAPVVDITHDINNASVGTRSLGVDQALVAELARAQIHGFESDGRIAACAKHFPGLGATPIDTHEALAVIQSSLDDLWHGDLVPFRAAVEAGVQTVMSTHVKFPAIDPDYPATLSPAIIGDLLREKIGYPGVVTTDCMEMKAISDHYGPGESAVLAALAGVDLILFSHTREYQEAAYDALLEAAYVGRLPQAQIDAAVGRIRALKSNVQPGAISVDTIRHPDHIQITEEAARAGTVLLRHDPAVFPLQASRRIGLVEFASYMDSGVMEKGEETGFVSLLNKANQRLSVEAVSLRAINTDPDDLEQARRLAAEADVLVMVTRNAHLIPNEAGIARELMQSARDVVLVCLRNPYDVDILPDAATVLCTLGDSRPSLRAAVAALLGEYRPRGHIPISLKEQD